MLTRAEAQEGISANDYKWYTQIPEEAFFKILIRVLMAKGNSDDAMDGDKEWQDRRAEHYPEVLYFCW